MYVCVCMCVCVCVYVCVWERIKGFEEERAREVHGKSEGD